MFSLLALNVLFILDFIMQQLTLQTNLAPLLKAAWNRSASLRDGMGCFEGRSSFFVCHSIFFQALLQESFGRKK